jgi:2-succinyl-5-enolpyruvyl-6-hydroxy-3-cyclohexene-1-carboxylate synthase
VNELRELKSKIYLDKIPFSDFFFEKVIPSYPKTHVANQQSSAIRYAQLIAIDPSIEVYCNRGTSGIDGLASAL